MSWAGFIASAMSAYGILGQDGQGGTDTLTGVEQIIGSDFADTISASGTAYSLNTSITLLGKGGDDLLTGGMAADSLDGGIGNDTIDGGAGADTLAGGAGIDTLRFDRVPISFGPGIVSTGVKV